MANKAKAAPNQANQVNQALVEAFKNATPKTPVLTSADKTYLRGLTKRGFTHDEILDITTNAGFKVMPDDLIASTRRRAKSG